MHTTKPYWVIYRSDGRITCVCRGDGQTAHMPASTLCAEFDTEDDLDEFIELRDLWEADV